MTDEIPASSDTDRIGPLADTLEFTENGIKLNEPDFDDTTYEIFCEGMPSRLAPSIDFFHDTPALHIYTYNQNEPEYSFLLPTNEHPKLRPLKLGDWENEELYAELRDS